MKTPVLESLCRPSGLQLYQETPTKMRCFPVNLAKLLRAPILKNI